MREPRAASPGAARSTFLVLLVVATFLPPAIVLVAAAGAITVVPTLAIVVTVLIPMSLSHVPATFHLIGSDPDTRVYLASHWGQRVFVPLAFVVAAPICMTLVPEAGASLVVMGFLGLQAWHFGRQNLGVLAFAALAAGSVPLSGMERSAVGVATVAGMLSVTNPAIFRPQGFQLEPLLESVPALRGVLAVVYAVGIALYVALIVWVIAVWSWRRPARSTAETTLFLGTMLFFLPAYLSTTALVAFWSYATAHAAQYLLFLSYHATGWSYGLGRNGGRRWPRGALGMGSLVSFAVSVVVLLRLQQGLTVPVATAVGTAVAGLGDGAPSGRALERGALGLILGITLAHFWLDQYLWRLREGSRRAWARDRYAFLFSS